MKEDPRNYMKIGIVHFMAFPETIKGDGPILETITKIARDDFFEVIEIGWINDLEVLKETSKLLRSSGLTVGFGAQPVLLLNEYDLNSFDSKNRFEAIDAVQKCINQATYLGAKRLAVLSGPDPGKKYRKKAREKLVDSLKEICSHTNGRLQVVLEIFDRDIDKKRLIGPSEEAAEVAGKVRKDFPDFGVMYDLSHTPLLNENPNKVLSSSILLPYLVHIHIGNCVKKEGHPLYGDQHPPFGIDGGENGVEELREFLDVLWRHGYLNSYLKTKKRPIVSFEVKPLPGQNPEVVITQSKRVFMEAWRRL